MPIVDPLDALQTRIGYRFQNPALIEQAMIHSSWRNEHPKDQRDYERLEFLGDAVLELCISEALFRTHPGIQEDRLTRKRASLVNETSLAHMARKFELGSNLRLGKGEEASGGRNKDSILSDAFEALLGALFLDAGYEKTSERVDSWFGDAMEEAGESLDHKSRLQSLLHANGQGTPEYVVVAATGPDHHKSFEVALYVAGAEVARANGRSKKIASLRAAERALHALTES